MPRRIKAHIVMILFAVVATSGVTTFGCDSDWAIWAIRSDTADPLYRFVERGKAGYIDQSGKVVIPAGFEAGGNYGGEFHEGILNIDEGYIDTRGRPVAFKDLMVWDFSEGLALAKVEGTDKLGYIDHTGKFVIPPRFGPSPGPIFLGSFSNGMASIDDWSIISEKRFDAVKGFSEGLAPVLFGDQWGFVDVNGAMIIQPKFSNAEPFSNGLAVVSMGGHYGYINHDGEFVIPPQFISADSFSDGLALVGDGPKGARYIDRNGKTAITRHLIWGSRFYKGLAHVKLSDRKSDEIILYRGEFAYIDHSGRIVFKYRR